MLSQHNDGPGPCHGSCCGTPDGCHCWQCDRENFPFARYPTQEQAAAAWGRWYDGEPEPPVERRRAALQAEPDPGIGSGHSAGSGASGEAVG